MGGLEQAEWSLWSNVINVTVKKVCFKSFNKKSMSFLKFYLLLLLDDDVRKCRRALQSSPCVRRLSSLHFFLLISSSVSFIALWHCQIWTGLGSKKCSKIREMSQISWQHSIGGRSINYKSSSLQSVRTCFYSGPNSLKSGRILDLESGLESWEQRRFDGYN